MAEVGPTGQQQTDPNTVGKNEWGRGVENAPGLRTAAPSSADRGMAEAGAPIFLTVKSRQPHYDLQRPTSRHPHVSSTPRRDSTISRTSHVSDTDSWHPASQPRLGRRPREPAGGAQRVTFRSQPAGGPARPARPPARRAPRPDWRAGAAARARGAAASPSSAVSILSGGRR